MLGSIGWFIVQIHYRRPRPCAESIWHSNEVLHLDSERNMMDLAAAAAVQVDFRLSLLGSRELDCADDDDDDEGRAAIIILKNEIRK